MDITAPKLVPEVKLSLSEKKALSNRLNAFYQQVTDYIDFNKVNNKQLYWEPIKQAILAYQTASEPVRVLEIGAGLSGFSEFLKTELLRHRVHYTAQDVTTQNADWLQSQADNVVLSDVSTVPVEKGFDIVFSTFVLEHVVNPDAHLNAIVCLLKKGGSLFIFCPRYDIPGYLCPSSRHLNLHRRVEFIIRWGWARLTTLLRGQPAFLIQTDLAAFHQPFFIDADAVHWVSYLDLQYWARQHNLKFQPVRLVSLRQTSLRNWIVKRWLTCAIQMQKSQ